MAPDRLADDKKSENFTPKERPEQFGSQGQEPNRDSEAKRIADFLNMPDEDPAPDTAPDTGLPLNLQPGKGGYQLREDPDGFSSLPTDLPDNTRELLQNKAGNPQKAPGYSLDNGADQNGMDYHSGATGELGLDYFALAGAAGAADLGLGLGASVGKVKKAIDLVEGAPLLQIQQTYIIAPTTNGYVLVHQQLAHERILYEQFSHKLHKSSGASQRLLIPCDLHISMADGLLLEELKDTIQALGYYIEKDDKGNYGVTAVPADMPTGGEARAIELLLEQFKHFNSEIRFSKKEKVIRCMARQQAVKAGKILTQAEMLRLVEDLFNCDISALTAAGDSPTYIEFKEDYLDGLFGIGK
jgi:DNA mismatch repair ATPase MutL